MSSGACRALVSLLLALVATALLVLPVAARTEALNENANVIYSVDPANGKIDVQVIVRLQTETNQPFEQGQWGPIVVEQRARPTLPGSPGFELIRPANEAPGLWKTFQVQVPRIEGGREKNRFVLAYPIEGGLGQPSAALAETPARIDSSYFYFCAVGQDADQGSVTIDVNDRVAWTLTQSGTPLTKSGDNGLASGSVRTPAQIFTCVEGVREDRLLKSQFVGPSGRQIELQAWRDRDNWLGGAESRARPVLDAIHRFLQHDIPGNAPVIIRMAPPRELGGYASAHDTPGIVQLDENAGVNDPEHQLAHAWFSTERFTELWLREGMALWTASAMSPDGACAPAGPNAAGLDLSDWQVVRPTSQGDPEQVSIEQDAAACGIVSAVAARMSAEQWREVIGSMLDSETKYISSAGPEVASGPTVDYREWLDAVDERGLVPAAADPAFAANLEELDFAQDLLEAFGIPGSGPELAERSAARALYHEFLGEASAEGLGAPLAVRKAMDDWRFSDATDALAVSFEVLDAIRAADELLPTAGLITIIRNPFESAASAAEIDAVRAEALSLAEDAQELVRPLGELSDITPPQWAPYPAVIGSAIDDRRFDDARAAIPTAMEVAVAITAAAEALPDAGLVAAFADDYAAAVTLNELQDLAATAASVRREAEATGRSLDRLRSEVGEWQIPAAVTDPIERGQISRGRAAIEDARAVVAAARAADIALPAAQLSLDLRPRFEAVTSSAQMAALRAEADERSQEASDIGSALDLLQDLVPEWQVPAIVTDPVAERDFARAALVAREAQRWVSNAWQADQAWKDFGALERAQPEFESADSLEALVSGADLADRWFQTADWINRAEEAAAADRDLLTDFGLWGVDVDGPLQAARDAGLEGNITAAINESTRVVSLVEGGSSAGQLRLGGLVFFGIAVLGVLGLWVILRRQSGPPWARQRKPHWLQDGRSRVNDKKDKKKGR